MSPFHGLALNDVIKDSRRNEREWKNEQETLRLLKEENRKLRRNAYKTKTRERLTPITDYGYRYKLVPVAEPLQDVALYIVLRTDEDVAGELTFGDYMDYVATVCIKHIKLSYHSS